MSAREPRRALEHRGTSNGTDPATLQRLSPVETSEEARPRAAAFVDRFAEDVTAGRVIGSGAPGGVVRRGIDIEGVIEVDHGALRIRPMIEQGWGRSALTYGPYERRAGLVFATLLLNGHNTSQSEPLPESMLKRVGRWARGHEQGPRSALRRMGQWLRYRRKSYLVHKVRVWRHMASATTRLDENLAVGWFTSEQPSGAPADGNAFVMHAALGDNGELWARAGGSLVTVGQGIQNVPMCYVSVLRETGAAYYLASVPGANGAGAFPSFRPYAIDATANEPVLYGGIHQAALGQIGFRVDTRVYGVQIEQVDALARWYGTAHAADRLVGSGRLERGQAEVGGSWANDFGGLERDTGGARASAGPALGVLRPGAPSGLVHALVTLAGEGDTAGIAWRCGEDDSHYRLTLDGTGVVRLLLMTEGTSTELIASPLEGFRADEAHSLQLADDGRVLRAIVDGQSVLGGAVVLERLSAECGVGVWVSGSGARVRDFEAHPREVDLGGVVSLPAPWHESGGRVVVADDFAGAPGELAGRATPLGGASWWRPYGTGRLLLTGDSSAKVEATIEAPNPGNTAYLVGWDDPQFVDVAVDITPPGAGRGEGERGRGGIVLWDGPENYLMISMYVDDSYDGASIAIFSHLDGFEDIYDAVWSMVGSRMRWGATHRLRVVSDGQHVMVSIDDEPVLYRSVTDLYSDRGPMRLHGVGLAVNWEWGDDTGTTFANFEVRGRRVTS